MQRIIHSTRENFLGYRISLNEEKKMKKSITRNCSDPRFAIFISLALLIFTLQCFDYSTLFYKPPHVFTFLLPKQENPYVTETSLSAKTPGSDSDSCTGRYIFMHELPSRFHYDFIKNCEVLTEGSDQHPNMCPYLQNFGFGLEVKSSNGVLSNSSSWYASNQYSLEIIFHNKMKRYECLTNDSSLASAIFVPFYVGLDNSRFMFGIQNETLKDSLGRDLVQWLSGKSEWKKMWGRDHFLVSGRIGWSYRRKYDNMSLWGSNFMFLPESKNMSMLTTEASSWKNDMGIPYPTPFHPSRDREIILWQRKIRRRKRPYLFTFAGAPRPQLDDSMRGKIISHCQSSKFCNFLDCNHGDNCYNPTKFMRVLQSCVFCLQPPGDSHTRKSIFDSILAGCIPVFFDPGSAYTQYLWHLPKNRSSYSVYIPVREVKEWNPDVEKILLGFSDQETLAMRKEVIKLIPSIIYADPRSKLEVFDDAFDIAVKGMLETIERTRELIRNGKDPSVGFADEDLHRYSFSDDQR